MSDFLLSQILIGIAIFTDTLSFQFKERKKIVACLLVSCTLISAHFMLLGHWTAASLGVIAAVRFTSSIDGGNFYQQQPGRLFSFLYQAEKPDTTPMREVEAFITLFKLPFS